VAKKTGRRSQLSDKQALAVHEYFMNGFNQGKALIAAGYSEATARTRPQSVFDRPSVREEIRRRQANMAKKFEVDHEWVLKQLVDVAGAKLTDILVVQEDGSAIVDLNLLTPEMSTALAEFTVEEYNEGRGAEARAVKKIRVKPADKLRALEMIARHLGMFNDKLELSGEMSLVERLQKGRQRARTRNAKEE